MFPPVAVFIGGSMLEGYTGLTLSRSKDDITGQCTVDLFFNYMPSSPVVVDAAVSKEFLVYIGGQLAFTGTLDKRTGSGIKHGKAGSGISNGSAGSSDRAAGIGPNEYTVQLTARGKTKHLIHSSHQHKSTNMLKPTTKKAIEELLKPFNVSVDFMGTEIDLDKIRFRDGAYVFDELRRIATEHSYYIYETRDGKLRVTDDIGTGTGDALILGQNILSFNATQSEDAAQSEITVKGQRIPKDKWGEEAVLNKTVKVIKDAWLQSYSPITVQHYGDGTEENLERRARFEANKQSARSKQITVEVFHVMAQGAPWDLGQLHYVEVPPEGIFDTFECTGISYRVTNDKELATTLTLSPPPNGNSGGATGLDAFDVPENKSLEGAARQGALGVTLAPGSYPFPWSGPSLSVQVAPASELILATLAGVTGLEAVAAEGIPNVPPLSLPAEFDE
jgi:prophage tail gpP-like protein